jgi:hypothetical protein
MATSRPRYLILDEPIPGSEVPQLLGRFIYDPTSPLDRFAPSTLPTFISDHIKKYGDQNSATLAVQSSSSEAASAKLQQIFSLASSRNASRSYDIETATITTYHLHDQDTAFDRLIALKEVRRQVETLFRRPGQRTNRIYMIVGLKVLVDATVKAERGGGGSGEASARVPVGVAISAAAGMPVPARGLLQAGVEWRQSGEANLIAKSQYEGEQVFAIAYRVIKKRLFPDLCTRGSGIIFSDSKRWGWGEGVMGDDDEEEDSDYEEDEARLPPLTESQLAKDGVVFWESE